MAQLRQHWGGNFSGMLCWEGAWPGWSTWQGSTASQRANSAFLWLILAFLLLFHHQLTEA